MPGRPAGRAARLAAAVPPKAMEELFPLLGMYWVYWVVNSHDGAVLGQLPRGIITCHFSSTKRGGRRTVRTEVVNIWDHTKLVVGTYILHLNTNQELCNAKPNFSI